jgi:hypothetical protein
MNMNTRTNLSFPLFLGVVENTKLIKYNWILSMIRHVLYQRAIWVHIIRVIDFYKNERPCVDLSIDLMQISKPTYTNKTCQ